MCSQVVLPPPSGQKKDTVTADLKECTMLFSFFSPSFIHHIVPHHKYFFSNNSVTKEAVIFPLIHYFRLPLRQEPLKASEQLLVSCNGLPLPDVVFTPRPQRQFALWPQLTEHIHQLHCQPTWVTLGEPQRDQKHFSSLLYSTTKVEDSPAVLQKKKTAISVYQSRHRTGTGHVIIWRDFRHTQQAGFIHKVLVMKQEKTPTGFLSRCEERQNGGASPC